MTREQLRKLHELIQQGWKARMTETGDDPTRYGGSIVVERGVGPTRERRRVAPDGTVSDEVAG
jgi:hypothetical protein